jgi:DNA-binding transcriptional ArsR family regulator
MAGVPTALLDEAAERFRLLSDATRLRLLNELDLAGELSVGELAGRAGVGLSGTSKHLHQLERGGVVGRRRAGTMVFYRVADPAISQLCDVVCASLRRRHAALAAGGARQPKGDGHAA